MHKKTTASLALIFTAVVTATVAGFTAEGKPVYVSDAEARTASYLTSSYGPARCMTSRAPEGKWVMLCTTGDKGLQFEYQVLAAEMAPGRVSRSFYLIALNEHARQSAQEGLMRYLQVDTGSR